MGWIVNAMFWASLTGVIAIAVHNVIVGVAVVVAGALIVVWLVANSIDCLQDIRGKRVAVITGQGRELPPRFSLVSSIARCVVDGHTFYMLNGAEDLLAAGDVTLYFVPRSRWPANMESTHSA